MSLLRQRPGANSTAPHSAQSGSGRHGDTGDRHCRGESATVISYQADTYSATIRTSRGRTLAGIPRLRSAPGEIAPLAPGTEVLLSYDYGNPIILGVLSSSAGLSENTPTFSATDTSGFGGQGENRDTQRTSGNYRQGHEPTDMLPGDYGYASPDGNMVGVLRGGTNVLKSSPLSQIRTHQLNDLVEIVSRNFRQITDMGESSVYNDNGRINLKFRGATDQRSEAGPDEENWTIRLDLGTEGDVLNFELTTPNGQTLFRFHVDADGHAEIFGVNGVDINSGGRNNAVEATGNRTQRIGGDQVDTVDGAKTQTVSGNSSTSILSDCELNVGNDYRLQAIRDLAMGAGRNLHLAVQGGEGASAMSYDIENGHWTINIGSVTSPNSGYALNTYRGNIDFYSKLGGNFEVDTRLGNVKTKSLSAKFVTGLPDSVVLGGEALSSHIVKFEQLQAHLMYLYALFDTHKHVHAGTAYVCGIIPVTGLSGPPVMQVSPQLVPIIPLFRSIVAGVSA